MNIYYYDNETGEYLSTGECEADPQETKDKGYFVPLVPAYATLLPPGEYEDDEVAVFQDNSWVIKTDYRNYMLVDDNLTVSSITTIDKPESGYVVNEATAQEITEYPDKFHNYEIGFPNSSSRQSLTNKYDYYMKVISNKDRTIRKRLKDFNKKKRSIDKIGHKSIIKTKTGIYMLLKYEDRSFYMLLNIKDYSLYRDHKANSVQDVYKNYTGRDLSDDIIGYLEYTEYDMYKLDSLGRYVLCNELIADTGVCFACL